MSRLDDIEREAKKRRADNEPDFDWSMLGRGEMEGLWRQAEAAVDELVAMVKEQQTTVQLATDAARKDALANHDLSQERDQARADVKKLRAALALYESQWGEYVGVTRPFHKQTDAALADTDREEYR